MKKTWLVMWGALLLIAGCAAIEPARVENGLYVNSAYQFSLRVPNGWETSQEIPEIAKMGMSYSEQQNFKNTFSDPANKRFILVAAEKTKLDWVSFNMYSDKFASEMASILAKEKIKNEKNKDCRYYRYEIFPDQIENCAGDCVVTKIEFQYGSIKILAHNILYKSSLGMCNGSTLLLVAHEQHYENSLDIFRTVVASFQRR